MKLQKICQGLCKSFVQDKESDYIFVDCDLESEKKPCGYPGQVGEECCYGGAHSGTRLQ